VVSLLLNHVVLEPGDAMFLGAGNLHAYLRGVGVELMANSDNVVRGGLTEKHVDVDELLSIVDTRPGPPPVERPAVEDHRYTSPVPEFSLTRLVGERPATERRFEPVGPEIVLVTNGHADLGPVGPGCSADAGRLRVESGSAAFVAPGDGTYEIYLGRGATAWRATVGDP
jgi:mannose-6-phosphate isomerase